jgi:glycosyltransferase involved in cell wall biosynthesis
MTVAAEVGVLEHDADRWSAVGPEDISVVVCAYTQARWDELVASVLSVLAAGSKDVIVVVDHNPALLRRCQEQFPQLVVLPNREERGLSGARNTGLLAAHGAVVAFIDDDAVAAPDWLAKLAVAYGSPDVVAVGGHIEPMWRGANPHWFPAEFRWVFGCSYRGLPVVPARVRNLIGCNMSFRRWTFDEIGGFATGLGRIDLIPVGCEETDLCIRVHQRWPERDILYLPDAQVHHNVSRGRVSVRYFVRRCFAEGRSKAHVASSVGQDAALSTERDYVRNVLVSGVRQGFSDARRGDRWGLARAAAIVSGLAITATGYGKGHLFERRRARSTAAS